MTLGIRFTIRRLEIVDVGWVGRILLTTTPHSTGGITFKQKNLTLRKKIISLRAEALKKRERNENKEKFTKLKFQSKENQSDF